MVTIVSYKKRVKDDGTSFFTLDIQGDMEIIQSQETGSFYATARKASISTTFDEMTCHNLIGKQIPGRITKVDCEPYEYLVESTGEVMNLSHRWAYVPDEKPKEIELEPEPSVFSQNGVYAEEAFV